MEHHPILAAAERVVAERLDPLLAENGFRPLTSESMDGPWIRRHWVREDGNRRSIWVDLSVSVHPLDIPWFVSIALGADKPSSFLDREQRSVPLWRFVEERAGAGDGYGFSGESDVGAVVGRIADDLAEHAADFLGGDLRTYDRLRGRVVPYPRTIATLSIIGQLLLMPWRAVWWTLRGGPRRMREAERAMKAQLDREDPD